MADQNTGLQQRSENDVVLLVGSDEIFGLVPNTLRINHSRRERNVQMDRGAVQRVAEKNEQAGSIAFSVYRTANLEALITAMLAATPTAGVVQPFSFTVQHPAYLGATSGEELVLTSRCYLMTEVPIEAGDDADTVPVEIMVPAGFSITEWTAYAP